MGCLPNYPRPLQRVNSAKCTPYRLLRTVHLPHGYLIRPNLLHLLLVRTLPLLSAPHISATRHHQRAIPHPCKHTLLYLCRACIRDRKVPVQPRTPLRKCLRPPPPSTPSTPLQPSHISTQNTLPSRPARRRASTSPHCQMAITRIRCNTRTAVSSQRKALRHHCLRVVGLFSFISQFTRALRPGRRLKMDPPPQ